MREMRSAHGEAPWPVWRIPWLLGLSEVQESQKTDASRRVADSLTTGFLDYLRAERDASVLTIRNYSADVTAFAVWFEEKYKQKCDWPRVDLFHLRGYLVHLTERQFDRATIHLKM